jgi:hypothetical protein
MIQRGVTSNSFLSVVPLPPRPGLTLVFGPHDVVLWALQVMTIVFSPKPIVWVDAANRFVTPWISTVARSVQKDPSVVLASFHMMRPFTAYQLEAAVTQKLLASAIRHQAFFSVIADPLSLYEGAEGRDTQVQQSFRRFVKVLHEVSAQIPLVLVIPEPGHKRYLPDLLAIATSRRRLQMVNQQQELVEA